MSSKKLWQNIRQIMGIPSTIPGTQKLIDVYLSCVNPESGSGSGNVGNGDATYEDEIENAENDGIVDDNAMEVELGGSNEANDVINGEGDQSETNETEQGVVFGNDEDDDL